MENYGDEIRDLLKTIVNDENQIYSKVCYIRSVDSSNKTCTVEDINHDGFDESIANQSFFIYDVKFSPDSSSSSTTPDLGYAYVTFFNNEDAFISSAANIQEVTIKNKGKGGGSMSIKSENGRLKVSFNERIEKFNIGRGFDYSKSDTKISIDYEQSWNRSKCGSVILLDCNVNISASQPNGKINISKKTKTPTINTKAKTLYKVKEEANEEAFISLLELNRLIISLIYNGKKNKQEDAEELFENYFASNGEIITMFYFELFKDLEKYYTKKGYIYTNQVLEDQITIANKLKEFSGYNGEIESIDSNVLNDYQLLYSIVQNASKNDLPLIYFSPILYKYFLYHQNVVFFMDTYIEMLIQIKSFLPSENIYYGFQSSEPKISGKQSLKEILDEGSAIFIGRENIDNDSEYIKSEEANIVSYREDTVVVSLGGLLIDFKDIVNKLTQNLDSLYTSGVETPSGLGTFKYTNFPVDIAARTRELTTLKDNINLLLL